MKRLAFVLGFLSLLSCVAVFSIASAEQPYPPGDEDYPYELDQPDQDYRRLPGDEDYPYELDGRTDEQSEEDEEFDEEDDSMHDGSEDGWSEEDNSDYESGDEWLK